MIESDKELKMYLYGLVHRSAIESLKTLALFGIATEVSWREVGELGAIVESGFPVQVCASSEKALIDAIVIHDRVLLSAFAVGTVLPLRFGTEFVSEQALLEHLEQHQSKYLTILQKLEGKAEVSLKLFAEQAEPEPMPANLKGRDYFLAKKEQAQQQQLIQTRLDGDRQTLIQDLQSQNIQVFTKVTDHYLLLCDRSFDLTSMIMNWKTALKWTWKISDSIPPYHFVGSSKKHGVLFD
jgi:Gas vesicle synthesis protein GvpL/GvpF